MSNLKINKNKIVTCDKAQGWQKQVITPSNKQSHDSEPTGKYPGSEYL